MCVHVMCTFQKGQKIDSAVQLAPSVTTETKFSPGMKTEVFMGSLKWVWLANACSLQSKKKFRFVIVPKNINRTMLSIARTTLRLVAHKPKSQALFVLISSGVHEKKAGSFNASFMEILFELLGAALRPRCTAWIFIAFQSWFSVVKNFWECAETLIALSHTRQVCILNY